MNYSELDISKLSEDDIYELVMSGIKDFSKESIDTDNTPDFLIILGCTPLTLEQRLLKMIELYDKGYGKYIIISGGLGWHKLFKANPEKKFKDDTELFEYTKKLNENLKKQKSALSKIFESDLQPKVKKDNQASKKYYRKAQRLMNEYLDETEAGLGYRMLESRGREDIESITLLESNSTDTIQNVLFTREIIEDLVVNCGIDIPKKIMLITSPFHCRRSILTFKKYFPNSEIIACPSTAGMEKSGVAFTKEALMNSDYYSKQFRKELKAIIDLSKNGIIADSDISTIVGNRKADEIENKISGEINR